MDTICAMTCALTGNIGDGRLLIQLPNTNSTARNDLVSLVLTIIY